MATLEKCSGIYRIIFRYGGQRFTRSLRTKRLRAAQAALARLEDNLHRLELGTMSVPPDAELATYLLSDGNQLERPKPLPSLSLNGLLERYFDGLPEGALEPSTLHGMRVRQRHLERLLGKNCRVQTLSTEKLQQYVNRRSKEPGQRGRLVAGGTIKKEMVTLRTVWNWAVEMELLGRAFSGRRLKYPKDSDPQRFRTWAEIEERVRHGGLSDVEKRDLWVALYLDTAEIDELLVHVKGAARHSFIYPMFCFAAHTGARRSELLRSQLVDLDFERATITIRERKRSHGKRTTRQVPMSGLLRGVLKEWLARHPGGPHTFCHGPDVPRSKKRREIQTPVTRDEANDHFKRTLKGSKWQVLRGWHLLRHSFCSNCAAKGVDQRLINEWVGHQTEQMVRRYRHLFPDQQRRALETVFGNGQQSLVLDAE